MRSALPPLLLAFIALPACATYQQSLHDTADAGFGNVSGDDGQSGGSARGGAAGSASTTGGQSAAGSSNGGSLGAGAGGAGVSAGAAGTGTGTSGSGGSGQSAGAGGAPAGGAPAGGAPAGGAPAGGAPAGGAPAGGAPAGGAPAGGAPAGGAPAGGAGGAVSTVNPCLRANWTATASESSLTMPDLYNPPPFAIDGMSATRWSSGMPPKGGEWFLVDLGAKASHLTKVVLDTTQSTGDFPLAYKLELSVDGVSYTQAATGAGADVTTISFADTPARYLKVTQTSTATQVHWWSIHELTVTCTP